MTVVGASKSNVVVISKEATFGRTARVISALTVLLDLKFPVTRQIRSLKRICAQVYALAAGQHANPQFENGSLSAFVRKSQPHNTELCGASGFYGAINSLARGLESSTLLESVLFALCSILGWLDALVLRAIANRRRSSLPPQQCSALVFVNSCGSNFCVCEVRWSSAVHRNSCSGLGACGIPHRGARHDESKPAS